MLTTLWSTIKSYVLGVVVLALLGLLVFVMIKARIERDKLQNQLNNVQSQVNDLRRKQVDDWTARLDSSNRSILRIVYQGDSSVANLYKQYPVTTSKTLETRYQSWEQAYRKTLRR